MTPSPFPTEARSGHAVTTPAPSRLREAARGAVERGLGFLEASIRPDGAWPSRKYLNLEIEGGAREELAPFVAALGALTLAACGDPRSRSLRGRARGFIIRSMRYPDVWRYWPELPNDLDRLSLCSQAAAPHPWLLFGMNLGGLRTVQDDRGRFATWLAPLTESPGSRRTAGAFPRKPRGCGAGRASSG